jgi:hypothetical protein
MPRCTRQRLGHVWSTDASARLFKSCAAIQQIDRYGVRRSAPSIEPAASTCHF